MVKRRIISIALVFALVLTTLSAVAFAREGDNDPVSFARKRGEETRYFDGDTVLLPRNGELYLCFDLDPYNGLIPGWHNDLLAAEGFGIDDEPAWFDGDDYSYAHITAGEKQVGDKGTLYYNWYRPEDIFGPEAVGWVDAVPVYSAKVIIEVTVPQTRELVIGDSDGDGELTILDATSIQRCLAELETDAICSTTADCDYDGKLTIIDASFIQRRLAEIPGHEDVGEIISCGTYFLVWNVEKELLPEGCALEGAQAERAREEIRRALGLLIDRRYIAENLVVQYNDDDTETPVVKEPASTLAPTWLCDADGSEFRSNAGRSEEYAGYYDTRAEACGANKAEAVEILKKYYSYDSNTGKFTNVPQLTYLLNDVPMHMSIADKIKSDFAALGIELTCDSRDWNTYFDAVEAKEYTFMRMGWMLTSDNPMAFLDWSSADNYAGLGQGAHAGTAAYSIDLRPFGIDVSVENGTWAQTFDVLVKSIYNCDDRDTAYAMMHLAEDMLMATGCVTPLYYY